MAASARRQRRKTWPLIFLSQVIVLIAQGNVCGAGFIIQPDPADGIAAIGQQAKFRCRASDGFKFSKWEVTIPEVRELSTSNNNHVNALRDFGVTFTSESERNSSLIFNATVVTSGTVVTCEVENVSNFLVAQKSSEVTTLFYGPPLSPSQVLVADLSNGSLWVSWNVSSTAPVDPTFSVTVLRNNSFTGEESTYTMSNLMVQNTVLSYNSSFCNTFYTWVTAENDAGRSSLSEVAVWVPPYRHDYPPVSLIHSLSRDITGIRLTVDLEVPSACPEYMAIVFDVVLTNDSGAVRMWRQSGLQPRQESLPAGQVLSLQVMSEGSSVSARETFVTSDVQDVDVCIRSEGLVIRCIFLSGSRTSGCGYKLVSVKDGVPDIFGYVAKAYTEGLDERINDTASYSEILIYDASGRDDRSKVSIAVNRSLQNLSSCPVTMTTGLRGSGAPDPISPFLVMIITVSVMAALIVCIMLVSLGIYCGYCCMKCRSESLVKANGCGGSSGKYKKKTNYYPQGNQVADKDCEGDYDVLDTVIHSARSSITTTATMSTRSSIITKTTEVQPRDFYEDEDYAQLNQEPVYQVLEAEKHGTAVTTTSIEASPSISRQFTGPASGDTYAQLNQEPLYHVLENNLSTGHRDSNKATPTTSHPPHAALEVTPPAVPLRSYSISSSPQLIKYSDMKV